MKLLLAIHSSARSLDCTVQNIKQKLVSNCFEGLGRKLCCLSKLRNYVLEAIMQARFKPDIKTLPYWPRKFARRWFPLPMSVATNISLA